MVSQHDTTTSRPGAGRADTLDRGVPPIPTKPSDGRPYDGAYRQDDASADRIESRIRETRRDMDRTLDELGRRFEPGNLISTLLGQTTPGGDGDMGRVIANAGRQIGEQVKRHPIPAALVGLGAIWLLSEAATGRSVDGDAMAAGAANARDAAGSAGQSVSEAARNAARSATSTVGDAAHATAQAVGESAHTAGEKIAHGAQAAAHSVSQAGGRAASVASAQAHRAVDATAHAYQERPLLFGLAAAAAGLAAGAVIPDTRAERRAFGATAQRWRGRIEEEGRQMAEAAIDSATQGVVEGAEELGQQIEAKVDQASDAARPEKAGGQGSDASKADRREPSGR